MTFKELNSDPDLLEQVLLNMSSEELTTMMELAEAEGLSICDYTRLLVKRAMGTDEQDPADYWKNPD